MQIFAHLFLCRMKTANTFAIVKDITKLNSHEKEKVYFRIRRYGYGAGCHARF